MAQILDPLVYYRLKSSVLSIMLQERQLADQKQAIFQEAGIPLGNYRFDDATLQVTPVDSFGQPIPESPAAEPPAPPDPPDPENF